MHGMQHPSEFNKHEWWNHPRIKSIFRFIGTRDDTRELLDRRVLIDLLNLPESILEPLDLHAQKWCSEPSVHGGKGTAPDGA